MFTHHTFLSAHVAARHEQLHDAAHTRSTVAPRNPRRNAVWPSLRVRGKPAARPTGPPLVRTS